MSKRCAVLTMADTGGWAIDADLAFGPMRALGWRPEWLPWRSACVDWDEFDAVYLGAAWDYPEDPERFIELLEAIDRSSAVLVNDLRLVRWNIPKTYLRDLEERGAAIVPSLWRDGLDRQGLEPFFASLDTGRIVVKPVVSTNATDTYLLERPVPEALLHELQRAFRDRPLIVQPFMASIVEQGEFSLFYLGGEFSHAILKVPKAGDFRVQEEHGARLVRIAPPPDLVAAADGVLDLVDPAPVYARCDFVSDRDGRFLLMELELVEPSLYLRMDPESPAKFAAAFDNYVRESLTVT